MYSVGYIMGSMFTLEIADCEEEVSEYIDGYPDACRLIAVCSFEGVLDGENGVIIMELWP
jgi:hypothetical protein